jgi:hypothetical protein
MSSSKDLTDVEQIVSSFGLKLMKYNNCMEVFVVCSCGNENYKTTMSDIKKGKKCIKCKAKRILEKRIKESNVEEKLKENKDEVWVKYHNRYISSKGKVKNETGEDMDICYKGRAYINGRAEYVSRAMVNAFKIENYEKLDNQGKEFVVSFKDGNNKNLNLDNLIVLSKSENAIKHDVGNKSRKSEKFKEYLSISKEDLKEFEMKTISFLEGYECYSNGMIYSNVADRVLTGSVNPDGYISICFKKNTYKFHRLMCIAFHPLENKNTYDDYKELQVNHKDGNKSNNNPENLEWVTQGENITHAIYNIKGNKKGRKISKYEYNFETKETGKKLDTYASLADASRKTDIEEHTIRNTAKGKRRLQKGDYMWRYDNEEESEEYKNKYSKHV